MKHSKPSPRLLRAGVALESVPLWTMCPATVDIVGTSLVVRNRFCRHLEPFRRFLRTLEEERSGALGNHEKNPLNRSSRSCYRGTGVLLHLSPAVRLHQGSHRQD